jgi:hypothetical protein
MERTEVWRVENGEGDRRLVAYAATRGFFFWQEYARTLLDEQDLCSGESPEFWATTRLSGLYDSLEAARVDAQAELPWTRTTKQ